jgi:hypothetical protein
MVTLVGTQPRSSLSMQWMCCVRPMRWRAPATTYCRWPSASRRIPPLGVCLMPPPRRWPEKSSAIRMRSAAWQTRRAIATHYTDRYGVDVPAQRIAVTTGSSAGFSLAFLAVTDPGGRVAITAPGYPAYRNIIKALSLEAVEIETDPADDHMLTVEVLEKAHRENRIDATPDRQSRPIRPAL